MDKYVVDVTIDVNSDELFTEPVFCFCPYREDGTIITGMGLLTDWPEDGVVVGIIHAHGQKAVEGWIDDNPDLYQVILDRIERRRGQ